MSLGTGAASVIWDDAGQQTLISSTSDLATGSISTASSVLDNSTTKATMCKMILAALDGFSGTWNYNPHCRLYMREREVVTSSDHCPVPDSSYRYEAVGAFKCDYGETTGAQYLVCYVDLVGVKKCEFYIGNDTGKVLEGNISSGWKLYAHLFSLGPTLG
jgi:hypothetical protein